MDTATLIAWQGRTPDAALAARLGRIAELRQQVAATEQALRRSQNDSLEREREQARLVNLIVQLGDDSAANRDRRARVDAIDAELAAAADDRARLAAQIEDLRRQIAELIAG
jgi:exonuclease VII large subunit